MGNDQVMGTENQGDNNPGRGTDVPFANEWTDDLSKEAMKKKPVNPGQRSDNTIAPLGENSPLPSGSTQTSHGQPTARSGTMKNQP